MKRHPKVGHDIRGPKPPEVPVAYYASLLADFPDAVLITDLDKRVVFLNRAAEALFEGAVALGAPCPICAPTPNLPIKEEVKGVLHCAAQTGQSVHRAPILFKDPQATHR